MLALLLVTAVAVPAGAAPIDDARKAFGEGKAAFEKGDYEAALTAYQRANMILPAPNLYFNIGVTYEKLGRFQEAALAFDKYFDLAGPPQSDDEREFQDKLHARAGADRQRPDTPTPTPPPAQPAPAAPPRGYYPPQQPYPQQAYPPPYQQPYYGYPRQAYPPPAYMPGPYPPPTATRQYQLTMAQRHRRNAITLMAIGVPLAVGGIILASYAGTFNIDTQPASYGVTLWAGLTFVVVGTTLWAPGAFSYVRSNRTIRELSGPNP
jgi:tetratricopeptide (TPR) repeat protein